MAIKHIVPDSNEMSVFTLLFLFFSKWKWFIYVKFGVMHNPNTFLTGCMRFTREFWFKWQLSGHVLNISTAEEEVDEVAPDLDMFASASRLIDLFYCHRTWLCGLCPDSW